MFRRAAQLCDFAPEEGDLVELRGRLAVYEPRGELQFVVESMRRSGAGALFERFLRLKSQLEAEGLFDAARKRPIPAFPRRVGIVTSLAAAALHDVLTALGRRAPHVALIVYPSPVQGGEAPQALAEAIARAGARAEVDTLIVCRGGGSIEDLWAFNEAVVVRAIAASPIPVVAGIGHETDVTLADFAADLRAPTPTAAAELAATPREAALEALDDRAERLGRGARQRLDALGQRLDRLAQRLARPAQALAPLRQRLALLAMQRASAATRRLDRERQRQALLEARLRQALERARREPARRLELLGVRLQALDPSRVLARGYAWLSDEAGGTIVSVAGLAPEQAVQAQLADGRLEARITAVRSGTAEPAPGAGG